MPPTIIVTVGIDEELALLVEPPLAEELLPAVLLPQAASVRAIAPAAATE
jgi:hypothetical protein